MWRAPVEDCVPGRRWWVDVDGLVMLEVARSLLGCLGALAGSGVSVR